MSQNVAANGVMFFVPLSDYDICILILGRAPDFFTIAINLLIVHVLLFALSM